MYLEMGVIWGQEDGKRPCGCDPIRIFVALKEEERVTKRDVLSYYCMHYVEVLTSKRPSEESTVGF